MDNQMIMDAMRTVIREELISDTFRAVVREEFGSDAFHSAVREELVPVNERLDKMDQRLGVVELKQDLMRKKISDMDLDIKVSERNIRKDISKLKDADDTLIAIMQFKGLLS